MLTFCYFSKFDIQHFPVQDTRSLFFLCVAAYDHIFRVEDFALLIQAVDNSKGFTFVFLIHLGETEAEQRRSALTACALPQPRNTLPVRRNYLGTTQALLCAGQFCSPSTPF